MYVKITNKIGPIEVGDGSILEYSELHKRWITKGAMGTECVLSCFAKAMVEKAIMDTLRDHPDVLSVEYLERPFRGTVCSRITLERRRFLNNQGFFASSRIEAYYKAIMSQDTT